MTLVIGQIGGMKETNFERMEKNDSAVGGLDKTNILRSMFIILYVFPQYLL